eukprot:scaffold67026_cov32-Prasinocladus_malaysianus.AAC.1
MSALNHCSMYHGNASPKNLLGCGLCSAMTGSLEAHAALADRYFTGRGVPESCWWGLHHAKLVADHAIQVGHI